MSTVLSAGTAREGARLNLDEVGKRHVIQLHLVYPKAMLEEVEVEQRTINDVASLAFISGRTNQRIGRKPPREYFKEIVKRRVTAALEAQLIPSDPDTLTQERFEGFLTSRRAALAAAINAHLERAHDGPRYGPNAHAAHVVIYRQARVACSPHLLRQIGRAGEQIVLLRVNRSEE